MIYPFPTVLLALLEAPAAARLAPPEAPAGERSFRPGFHRSPLRSPRLRHPWRRMVLFHHTLIKSWGFLIGGIPTPLKNMSSSGWIIIPTLRENKNHVPNHQPVFLGIYISKKHGDEWWFPLDFNINPWSPTAWPPERTPRTPNAERRRALSGGRNRPRLFAGSVGPWRGGVCPGEAEITWRLRCPICHMRGAVLYICILGRTIFLVFKFLCFNNSIYL